MSIKIKILLTISVMLFRMGSNAQTQHWGVQDGLPTGEVRQIIALPNHQMLINCEGVFCISNGAGFNIVPCDRRKAYLLEPYPHSPARRKLQATVPSLRQDRHRPNML